MMTVMIQKLEPYAPRRIHWLENWQAGGWAIKIYVLNYADSDPDEALLAAAKQAALEVLPQPAVSAHRYGVGFLGLHQGRSYDFVFVDWWKYESELEQHHFMRPDSHATELEEVTSELSADVWDLYLLAFERQAWVNHVLKAEQPDISAYMAAQLNETL
jgi:hypothetical protein